VLDLAVAGAPGTPRPGVVACAFYRDAQRVRVVAVGSDGKTFVFETSLAEYSDRNNGAASTKDRDERNCPDGIAEQRAPIPILTATMSTIAAGITAISRFTARRRAW
jgi:hypothetical protein